MQSETVVHHRWTDIAAEQLNESVARQYITADRVTIARFELKRGGVVPRHAHENEQVSMVLSGALLFRIDGREVTIRRRRGDADSRQRAARSRSARGRTGHRRVQPGSSGLDRQDRHVFPPYLVSGLSRTPCSSLCSASAGP